MGLIVRNPGTFATVQDAGRFGFRPFGVPTSGPFDDEAHGLANALVGNPEGTAALELTGLGGGYEALTSLALALAGAPMVATVEREAGGRQAVQIPQSLTLRAGDRLVLGGSPVGMRAYLAVRGGWDTPVVLGSRSAESPLRAGDLLPAAPGMIAVRRPRSHAPEGGPGVPIRILSGPDALPSDPWEGLAFRVGAEADRMGIRLEGAAPAVAADPDRRSAPVAPGAVQVAGGRLLVLGVACGTMGGYPHVAHVVPADLRRLAQARPGDAIRFRLVSPSEARAIDREDRRSRAEWLARVRTAACDEGLEGGH